MASSVATPPRRAVIALFVVFAMVITLLPRVPASATPADESSFIDEVNATRAGVGLPALTLDVELTILARGWADSMESGACGAGNFICHASPISEGVTHPWAKLGENVGTGPDVRSVMEAFIASPGHFANIVDPEFTHIGVGVVWDGGRLYTTHRFMKLQGSSAPSTTAAPTTTTTAVPTTTEPPDGTTPTSENPAQPTPLPPETPVVPPVKPARANVVVRALANLS
ncbi:MAG: CAP domain-containing protein [Acidimicrobiales bacterium]